MLCCLVSKLLLLIVFILVYIKVEMANADNSGLAGLAPTAVRQDTSKFTKVDSRVNPYNQLS